MENKHVEYNDNQYYEPLIYHNYGEFNYDDIGGFFIDELNFKFISEINKVNLI